MLTARRSTSSSSETAAEHTSGERVLVVNDEAAITELVTTALRFVGFEVQAAASGREALATASSFLPDLVILEVMMPGLDGIEAISGSIALVGDGEGEGKRDA